VRYGDLYTTHTTFIRESRSRIPVSLVSTYTPIQHGDVLFAASGETFEEIGKSAVNLIPGAAVCGGDLILLRPSKAAVPAFLGYACDSYNAAQQKASMGRGTTVKHIYPDQIRRVVIPLPPVEEQLAITKFLDREIAKIDALVTEQERLIQLLVEGRQSLISNAVTRGLNSSAAVKASGIDFLGDIPVHWAIRKLKHFSPELTVGIVVEPSKYYVDEGVPALRSLNIAPGAIRLDSMVFISKEANRLHEKSILRTGDLVAVRSGRPGTTAVIPSDLDGCNCVDLIIIRRPTDGDESFLCWYLASDAAGVQFSMGSDGAIQQHFNVSTASELLVPVPPEVEQRAVARFLDVRTYRLDSLQTDLQRTIAIMRERRHALIAAAVTGQIDVRGTPSTEAA
jgi:type I restriction enzyme S subunit